MRTTHVVRGEEWIPSTPVHIQLFEAMGFEAPQYIHVPLIMVKDGNSRRKLSKRKDKEAAVSYFLKAGYPTEAVMEYLMTVANSDYEIWRNKNKDVSNDEFNFKLNKMSSAGSLLDIPKLNDISKEIISKMDSKEVLENVLTWSKKYDNKVNEIINRNLDYSKNIFALERDGAKKIRKDIIKWEDIIPTFFYFFNDLYKEDIDNNGYSFDYLNNEDSKLNKEIIKKVLQEYMKIYNENDSKDEWFSNLKEVANSLGFCTDMKEYKQNKDKYIGSTADFAGIIRIAVTNRHNTPDIYQIMKLLGKEEVINRFQGVTNNI